MIEHMMLELFGGNMSAYGNDDGGAVRRPVTNQLMLDHLKGLTGIGIYPMWHQDDQWWVKWGCCDIDTGNWDEAYALTTALQAMGMVPYVERSRSKGWHVWVFAEKRVLAQSMRRALKVAYAAIDLPAKEANPKSEQLREGQLGNYVRLPFKGSMVENCRRQVMTHGWDQKSDGEPIQVRRWLYEFDHRTAPETIEHWASKWREPKRERIEHVSPVSDEKMEQLMVTLPGDLFNFIKTGPTHDRSGGLVSLAYKLRQLGLTPDEIYACVDVADQRWGKYTQRPNRESFILDIVERVL